MENKMIKCNEVLYYIAKWSGRSEIPLIEKIPEKEVKINENKPKNNDEYKHDYKDDDEDQENDIIPADLINTSWNIGLLSNLVLNGILWFSCVLIFY